MKQKKRFLFLTLAILLLSPAGLFAQNQRQFTTTLLPEAESGNIENGENEGLLWIQNNPSRTIVLRFNLSSLPDNLQAADLKQCTLRLVAQNAVYKPEDNPNTGGGLVIVKGRLAGDGSGKSLISLSTLSKADPVAINGSKPFCDAVYQVYKEDKILNLELFTESHKAGALLYSCKNQGTLADPTYQPRLVIEYFPGPPSLLESLSWTQHQQNPEHTGTMAWQQHRNPVGFSVDKIDLPKIDGGSVTISDYPLIYRGGLFLVVKAEGKNYLTALDFGGRFLWKKDLGEGTVQRSPVISRNGLFYVVFEQRIVGHDLNLSGRKLASHGLSGKLGNYTDMTVGNDGSVFLALKENEVNYIYAFGPDLSTPDSNTPDLNTSNLRPIIKVSPLGAGQENLSTISVSGDGREIFVQSPQGGVVVDISNPSNRRTILLKRFLARPWERYHTPLAGPEPGVMIFSDFSGTTNKGNVWGVGPEGRLWNSSGTSVCQPVLGANGRVYYIQDGRIQAQAYGDQGNAEIRSQSGLNATSNLVMDGGNNLYFWNNGFLNGYDPDGKPLFDPEHLDGPEQFIRLMAGTDGTLWANNKNGSALYAFRPRYASPDIRLVQADIRDQTVYRASGSLNAASVSLPKGSRILMQAGKVITFSKGFSVDKGATLLCRTGF